MSIGAHLAAPGARDVVGDVGGKCGLAHPWAAGDDDEIGGLQAAHLAVEVLEAGCQAGELSFALVSARRHVDGGGERSLEFMKSAVITPYLGALIQTTLGILDLIAGREIDWCLESDVHH